MLVLYNDGVCIIVLLMWMFLSFDELGKIVFLFYVIKVK